MRRGIDRTAFAVTFLAALTWAPIALAAGGAPGAERNWTLLGLNVLNFAILLFVLYRFAGPAVRDFLYQRSEGIRAALQEAETKLAAAQAEVDALRGRIESLEGEAREMLAAAQRQAEAERAHMQERAQQAAARMAEEAQRVADQEIARARQGLRETAASLAATLAGELLRENMSDQDDARLVDEFVSRVEGGAS